VDGQCETTKKNQKKTKSAMSTPETKLIEDEMSMYRQLEAQQNYILRNRQTSMAQLRENEMVLCVFHVLEI
jgi:hypothetical protein